MGGQLFTARVRGGGGRGRGGGAEHGAAVAEDAAVETNRVEIRFSRRNLADPIEVVVVGSLSYGVCVVHTDPASSQLRVKNCHSSLALIADRAAARQRQRCFRLQRQRRRGGGAREAAARRAGESRPS